MKRNSVLSAIFLLLYGMAVCRPATAQPVIRLTGPAEIEACVDFRSAAEICRRLQAQYGDRYSGLFSEIQDLWSEHPNPDGRFIWDIRFARDTPALSMVYALPEEANDLGEAEGNLDDGSGRIDEMVALRGNDHIAVGTITDVTLDTDEIRPDTAEHDLVLQHLRRCLLQTGDPGSSVALRSVVRPTLLARTYPGKTLKALIARWRTASQRADNETEDVWHTRTAGYAAGSDLMELVLNQLSSISIEVDSGDSEDAAVSRIRLDAVQDSELSQWCRRCGSPTQRGLRFVHPDHNWFISLSIPVSEEMERQTARFTSAFLSNTSEYISASVAEPLLRLMTTAPEGRCFDVLVQEVSLSAQDQPETGGIVAVFPQHVGPELTVTASALMSLALTARPDEFEMAVAEFDGYQIHRWHPQGDPPVLIAVTDTCVALAIGPDEMTAVMKQILSPEYEPPAETQAFRSCFVAAEGRSVRHVQTHFGIDLEGLISVEDSAAGPQPGRVTVRSFTEQDAVIVEGEFQGTAMALGTEFGATALMATHWLIQLLTPEVLLESDQEEEVIHYAPEDAPVRTTGGIQ